MADALGRLARAVGLAVQWQDYRGDRQGVAPDTLRAVLTAMELPCDNNALTADTLARVEEEQRRARLPPLLTAVVGEAVALPGDFAGRRLRLVAEDGARRDVVVPEHAALALPADLAPGYHRLELADRAITLALAPARACAVGDAAPGGRPWGVAAQLYALRRSGDGGVGDYTALAQLARAAGREGADALAISPVHAPFPGEAGSYSPYSPSSRLFLNPWHVDPAALPGAPAAHSLAADPGLDAALERLEALPLVDWAEVARVRQALLRGAFARWLRDPQERDDFAAFRARGGEALEDHARFEAIHADVAATGGARHWRDWPAALRDARGRAAAEFARAHAAEVEFHVFAQWAAARGLAAAQRAGRDAGMRIGLIADLAVGTDDAGSHAWSRRHDLLVGLSVGAPPDEINDAGQAWGLTTFSPRALREHGYAPFLEMLRASLRHAGGLRIDHVLGLNRLWLVPRGADPRAGAYLRYPLDDLLRLIALESHRHRAVIIGEDLGTVPEGFRERLAGAGLLGLRVLWFERDHGFFVDPARWPAAAVATTSTHDLPTVAGWWTGRDLDWRERLGADAAAVARDRRQRDADRRALWAAFVHSGVTQGPPPATAAPAVDAAVAHVARAPSALALVPLDDLLGLEEQPNLPGTIDQHPNWRRRLPADAVSLLADGPAAARLAALRRERGARP